MLCEKCGEDITDQWESGITYKGEEEHHNPPKFMMEEWSGTLHDLCVDCHDNLHEEIIKILNKTIGSLKFCNSEYWVWKKMSKQQREEARLGVVKFTLTWLKKDGNTKKVKN
tara:strand:- start:743 stop:1078 length:336 start_codon:yes stop_codon:yes gene_type:complete